MGRSDIATIGSAYLSDESCWLATMSCMGTIGSIALDNDENSTIMR